MAALFAVAATPHLQAVSDVPNLEATVPQAFGDWKIVQQPYAQVGVSQGVEGVYDQPYDQTVMRTYVNSRGEAVMLALAWGEKQRQDIKVHRPEVCYPAQGFSLVRLEQGAPIQVAGHEQVVPTVSLLAAGPGGGSLEAVRYWIRIGQSYTGDGLKARWYILQEGFQGRIPDGILVRASKRIRSADDAADTQVVLGSFLAELAASVPPATRALLVR